MEALPTDELKEQAWDFLSAVGERAVAAATDRVGDVTGRLIEYAQDASGGDSGSKGGSLLGKVLGSTASTVKDKVKDKVADKLGGGSGGGHSGGKAKLTNIIEQIEVGVPVRVAYNQWTQFQDFPKFTKRIETVSQESDEKVSWKAGIYFSHRQWESTIVEQIPDERIVWHSQGDKGYVDGTVTFHEITPDLTKILLVLEYHAQGLFERTGNMFRVQRRRARLELQHFDRHVMTQTILDQDDVEGWRGEIRDSEVVRSHEDALEEEDGETDADDEQDEESEEGEEGEYADEDEEFEDEYEDADEDDVDDVDDEGEDAEDGRERESGRSRRGEPARSR